MKRVLIANRGEIAVRVIRALRELGIQSVAVFSEADRDALHVKFADEAVCIGPAAARDSYLKIPALISAAEITAADGVHPGYGFLSESAEFAEICQRCNLTWIGPRPETMELMGNKVAARKEMESAGVPVLPGSQVIPDEATLRREVERIGLPVILKAAAGGGGRGMKVVREISNAVPAWEMAMAEAQASFGDSSIYVEKFCENPRHIEVQVIGDQEGNVALLGERECSLQRRHQKIVEEAPSASLSPEVRESILQASLRAAEAIGYQNAGTLEFLLDGDGQFYFMEMNTRLQVEHPVTEMVTGIDLVREQIRIAMGDPLSFSRTRKPRGHAIELRINAEDPNTFQPSPGRITALNLPGGLGVRLDTHIYEGYVVPHHYDSLLAKLIVHDLDRRSALDRVNRCLNELVIEGVKTNLNFHKWLLSQPEFIEGIFDIGYVERVIGERKWSTK